MRFLKITLAYDGASFAGWQVQPGQTTIQSLLEEAWLAVTNEVVRAVASGRTDAGVHALGQVVSLATGSSLSCDVLTRAVNANLPSEVRVRSIEPAADGFHAIRHALAKRYRYLIQDKGGVDLFLGHYAWQVSSRLDVEAMSVAAPSLVGCHDFAAYQAAGSERATTVRTVADLSVQRQSITLPIPTDWIVIEVEADGFLYNMVRNLVGTLVEVGRGVQPPSWPAKVLAGRDRRAAGPTAPARGLFLVCVDYGEGNE